ncbi:hypothetical protein [Nocardia brevicatena]|nr:hypothetical protein [Nocardia brevicatena]
MAAAEDASFRAVRLISSDAPTRRYFADRTDGLRPAESEQIPVAAR